MKAALSLLVASLVVAGCSRSSSGSAGNTPSQTQATAPKGDSQLRPGPTGFTGAPSKPIAAGDVIRRPLATRGNALVAGCTSTTVAMKVLVLAAGNEADLPAVQEALQFHGIPFTLWNATTNPGQLTADKLATGCAGAYQGIILTTNAVPPTAAESQVLSNYAAGFGVRELTWYGFPSATYGLNTATVGAGTATGTLTDAGKAVFSYLNPAASITIANAWTYLAKPLAEGGATPLLVDASGDALVSTWVTADGREIMTVTFDSNQFLLHDLALAHGYLEWLTKGVYLGQYRAYLTPQVDDLFIEDEIYPVNVDFCGTAGFPACVCTDTQHPNSGAACTTYGMTPADMARIAAWQDAVQAQPGNAGFKLALAFNGVYGVSPLTTAAKQVEGKFTWINHTLDHLNLTYQTAPAVGPATTTAQVVSAFTTNEAFAKTVGLTSYRSSRFVSPDVSGLANPQALQALSHLGVRYLITDTSHPEQVNPSPNVGMYDALLPSLYEVPRRPTNLFYDVSTQAEWVGQYNALYAATLGTQTIQTILDRESGVLLTYMLQGDIDPHMYHESNLRAYDGTHSNLSDLIDATIQKFRAISALPIESPDLLVAGARMKANGALLASNLTATLAPGTGITFTSSTPLSVPVSVPQKTPGVCPAGADVYGTKCIVTVSVPAGAPATLSFQ
ncbi:MAG TPA: hypothetical protein VF400_04985 [Anaeromyxobacteraceae bacterium]